jgi:hypothetical protein
MTPLEIPEAQRKLVAWWKFDETEGDTTSDSSGNNHVGTLAGGPQWQPAGGKIGGALAFDGVDDFIDCGADASLNLTKGVSVAMWIKLAGHAEDQKIAGNQDDVSGGYKVGIYSDKVELEIRDSGNSLINNRFVDGGTILQPGVWYHVVGTYWQGGSIKTYVNAKLDRALDIINILAPSTGTLKIGREPFSDLYWFNGLMDDLRIYNYPLAEAEVAALYSGQALPTMTAKTEIPATAKDEPGTGGNWIPVLVIVIIAAAAAGLVSRRKKTTS